MFLSTIYPGLHNAVCPPELFAVTHSHPVTAESLWQTLNHEMQHSEWEEGSTVQSNKRCSVKVGSSLSFGKDRLIFKLN